jgi:hypothetical protein
MRRDAWLAALGAVLGVSNDACRPSSSGPAAVSEVVVAPTASAPSPVADAPDAAITSPPPPAPKVSAPALPSATASASPATPRPRDVQTICGAPASPMLQGGPSGVERHVAQMRSAFRRCYNQALVSDPNVAGAVTLKVVVSPSGAVTSVTPSTPTTLPAPLVACLTARVKQETFDAADTEWSFTTPIRFTQP